VAQNTKPPKPEQPTQDDLTKLLKRAEQGDVTVLSELRKVLDGRPDLCETYGDLSLQAEAAMIKLAAGPNILLAETLVRKLAALKSEVAGASPSPLERLLAERIAACWLQVSYFDALLAQAGQASPARLKLLQQQQDAAHRRQLSALKTLAIIRKLLVPTPSPVEIATRFASRQRARHDTTPAAGVPVAN
jgi:hypothetical protein